jgi:hypothetical protein
VAAKEVPQMSGTNLPAVHRAKLPDRYLAAKAALQKCERIDECKDWADKAAAMASYAKQVNDDSLLRMSRKIKARAIRRVGQLLKGVGSDKAGRPRKNGTGAGTISRTKVASDAGLSKRQKDTALRVANIPEKEFEDLVESTKATTVDELANLGKKPRKIVTPRDLGLPDDYLQGATPEEYSIGTQGFGHVERFVEFWEKTDPKAVARGSRGELRELAMNVKAAQRWLEKLLAAVEEERKTWKSGK